MTAWMRPSKATALDARAARQPRMGRTRWKLCTMRMADAKSGHVVGEADVAVPRTAETRIGNVGTQPPAVASTGTARRNKRDNQPGAGADIDGIAVIGNVGPHCGGKGACGLATAVVSRGGTQPGAGGAKAVTARGSLGHFQP